MGVPNGAYSLEARERVVEKVERLHLASLPSGRKSLSRQRELRDIAVPSLTMENKPKNLWTEFRLSSCWERKARAVTGLPHFGRYFFFSVQTCKPWWLFLLLNQPNKSGLKLVSEKSDLFSGNDYLWEMWSSRPKALQRRFWRNSVIFDYFGGTPANWKQLDSIVFGQIQNSGA